MAKLATSRKPAAESPVRFTKRLRGDARHLPLETASVDLVVTSPPYWKKRDYGVPGQLGQEATPDLFVGQLMNAFTEWHRVLADHGSVYLNIGDTYSNRKLALVPARLEIAADEAGWSLRNRIIWAKEGGMPDPARDRLASRHEFIFHFVKSNRYYSDLHGYAERFGNGANPGDLWTINLRRDVGKHLAPYPPELVERAIELSCPSEVCTNCGAPRRRLLERTSQLDSSRPQARRAMQLAKEAGLSEAHIRAIQATGISDAGKAQKYQTGTGKNSSSVQKLAAEAKAVLGGYFREFTFAAKKTAGWTDCACGAPLRPGVVLDPFMGTGTTLRVAEATGRSAIGVDLALLSDSERPKATLARSAKAIHP